MLLITRKLACTLCAAAVLVSCRDAELNGTSAGNVDSVPLPPFDQDCVDLAEGDRARSWTARTYGDRYVSVYASSASVRGADSVRLFTLSPYTVRLRLDFEQEWDVAPFDVLYMSVRGRPYGGTWQNRAPEVWLIDARGKRRRYRADEPLASTDGVTWTTVAIPLHEERDGFSIFGSSVDLRRIVAVELMADTTGNAFRLEVDGLYFAAEDGSCDAPPATRPRCDEITEGYSTRPWSLGGSGGAESRVSILRSPHPIDGSQAVRVTTQSGLEVKLRRTFDEPQDVSDRAMLMVSVRAFNGNDYAWQNAAPEVVLEDARGAQARYRSTRGSLAPTDGLQWREVRVPLAGGPGWSVTGQVDLSSIAAVELVTDTWGSGYTIDFDRMYFSPSTPLCGRAPAEYDYWPNPISRANSDPWLVEHREEINRLEPKVMVLNFVNPSDPAAVQDLVEQMFDGFEEASRPRGYEDPAAEPRLSYRLARSIVDLRDGAAGRPPAPHDWTYENSTLMPRRPPGEPGQWRIDYAELFGPSFAAHYGFGGKSLCTLVEEGKVHEVWLVTSGETPEDPVTIAESIEHKQRYDEIGNKLPGEFDNCGNGCFDADVPTCGRSLRILSLNYKRGPGCALHAMGHLVEGQARRDVLPGTQEWFVPFARFDLDTAYGLPFGTLYDRECTGVPPEPDWGPGCIEHPTPNQARFYYGGATYGRSPWDPSCGSVHFPPNARSHYDYMNTEPFISSCSNFGRGGGPALVDSSLWADYEAAYPDCGGGFLVWWYQNMPASGSGHVFADGRPMASIWPALFF